MRGIRFGAAFLVMISGLGVASESYAQPGLPRKAAIPNVVSFLRDPIEKLHSSDPLQRADAAISLGRMKGRAASALSYLIEMLRDKRPFRWVGAAGLETSPCEQAIWALGRIGDVRAVEPLILALRDEDSRIRRRAAEALGEIGDGRAVRPLIAALSSSCPYTKSTVANALQKITKEQHSLNQADWLAWWDKASDRPLSFSMATLDGS